MYRTEYLVATLIALCLPLPGPEAHAEDPRPASAGSVLIFAAASTTDGVEQCRKTFEQNHAGVRVRASYGASSSLAKQVAAGAGADLLLSASGDWEKYLKERKLVAESADLLGNSLVIVTPIDSKLRLDDPKDLRNADFKRLALADPAAVPAGVYAKQALTALEIWPDVERRVAAAADVRQALKYVETGAAEVGVVYATDAAASKLVKVRHTFDAKLTDPIVYPLILTTAGAKNPSAKLLYDELRSKSSFEAFQQFGFIEPSSLAKNKPRGAAPEERQRGLVPAGAAQP